jgi:hypothetical protein
MSIIQDIKNYSLTVPTQSVELAELNWFLHPIVSAEGILVNQDSALIVYRLIEADNILTKIRKKLSGASKVRSIKLTYNEIESLQYFYKKFATVDRRVKYPQMVLLYVRIDKSLSPILNS